MGDWFLLLPILAAAIYPLGSLWIKQAQQIGVGPWRCTLISNWVMAACFLILPLFRWDTPDWDFVLWPVLAGLLFLLGQLFTVLAVQAGDVSVQAPLMGTKTVFVALYSVFLLDSEQLTWTIWLAAAITTVAIFLLGGTGTADWRRLRKAVFYAVLSCVFFAGTDAIVGGRGKVFGPTAMLLCMMATLSISSVFCWPLARRETMVRGSGRFLLFGGIAYGVQALILGIALSVYGRATTINIVYSVRGLFGIALVWFLGHWFANRERAESGPAIMIRRTIGALLLLSAIMLAVLEGAGGT